MHTSIAILKAIPLFSKLPHEDMVIIVNNSRVKNCPRGQFLFTHGKKITHFYVLCRGTIQVFRETPDGHEVTSDMMIAGDSINTGDIITEQLRHYTNARAVDNTVCLEIPVHWIKKHFNDFHYISTSLIAGISERLYNTQIEAEHQATMSATQIVACYLQRLCVLYDYDPKGFELPYSKTMIASKLRIELATFSRTLKRLKEEGITVEGTHISFDDFEKINHFVCSHCSLSEECSARLLLHP